jgi:uncharacterized protein (DUF433 family)
MQLEDYFDFQAPNDIRIKGHRIGIETILYEYIDHDRTAEEIAATYTTHSLDQVYATILYYLRNKEQIRVYLTEIAEFGDRMWAEQQKNPTPSMLRLRKLRAEREEAGRRIADPTQV